MVLRTVVQSRLEEKPRDKIIGSSLEGKVIVHASKANPAMYDVLKTYQAFLIEPFLLFLRLSCVASTTCRNC